MVRSRLAAVTMAYNEEDFLPIWLRHYARQVGRENCFILDHGSTDGSTLDLRGANVVRLPRTPLDEELRCRFVSDFCASLLHWYEFVAYADVDELLVADPAHCADLSDLCHAGAPEVMTAFGVNVVHRLGREAEIQPSGLMSRQRSWLMPVASMCKPSLISRPVRWAPGFHSADADIVFGDLFLMHMAFADFDIALRRQRRRQRQARARDEDNPHHQVGLDEVADWMKNWSNLQEVADVDLSANCPARSGFADQVLASRAGRQGDRYRIDITLKEERLWPLPPRFAGSF